MNKCPSCAGESQDSAIQCQHCGKMLPANPSSSQPGIESLVKEVLRTRGKIEAIKFYRRNNQGMGLAEAKNYVDRIEKTLPESEQRQLKSGGCSLGSVLAVLIFLGIFVLVLILLAGRAK